MSSNESHDGGPALKVVPPENSPEFEDVLAELVAQVEFDGTPEGFVPEWESLTDYGEKLLAVDIPDALRRRLRPSMQDERLLAHGLPVAFPVGDEMPDGVDDDADCHEAAVVSIEVARLRRF